MGIKMNDDGNKNSDDGEMVLMIIMEKKHWQFHFFLQFSFLSILSLLLLPLLLSLSLVTIVQTNDI